VAFTTYEANNFNVSLLGHQSSQHLTSILVAQPKGYADISTEVPK
jgi:hypothetical protein